MFAENYGRKCGVGLPSTSFRCAGKTSHGDAVVGLARSFSGVAGVG